MSKIASLFTVIHLSLLRSLCILSLPLGDLEVGTRSKLGQLAFGSYKSEPWAEMVRRP